MSIWDRTLLAVAGVSGCVSVWLAFQAATQWTLTPTASPSNLTFLVVVTGTIVTLLVTRRGGQATSGKVNRRLLLLVGGAAAIVLMLLSRFFDRVADTGEASITMAPEASLAGIGGVGILLVLARLTYLRIERERTSEQAPGPGPGEGTVV